MFITSQLSLSHWTMVIKTCPDNQFVRGSDRIPSLILLLPNLRSPLWWQIALAGQRLRAALGMGWISGMNILLHRDKGGGSVMLVSSTSFLSPP